MMQARNNLCSALLAMLMFAHVFTVEAMTQHDGLVRQAPPKVDAAADAFSLQQQQMSEEEKAEAITHFNALVAAWHVEALGHVGLHHAAKGEMLEDSSKKLKDDAPYGWAAARDGKTGRIYFYNKFSRTSQWTPPRALPAGWSFQYDGGSRKWYYYNEFTKKSQWEAPFAAKADWTEGVENSPKKAHQEKASIESVAEHSKAKEAISPLPKHSKEDSESKTAKAIDSTEGVENSAKKAHQEKASIESEAENSKANEAKHSKKHGQSKAAKAKHSKKGSESSKKKAHEEKASSKSEAENSKAKEAKRPRLFGGNHGHGKAKHR